MAASARYTRFVGLSKRFLWVLVALMVALVVWIASDSTENGARLVFSGAKKGANLANVMANPHYQGVDARDRPYTVLADQATQVDADNVDMVKVRADMTMASGAWVALRSGAGHLNPQSKQLQLTGGVDLFYEGGYEFRSDHAHVDIGKGTAYGDAHVEGQGPPGTLTADSFTLSDHGQDIRFNGSVRMILYR
jgi:lipopolysaccharide export system protein LptC